MPIISLPRIFGWMKKRTWKADIWNRLYNIEQHMVSNQTALTESLSDIPHAITRIRIYTINMTVANREYSQLLPDGTKSIEIQVTDGTAFRVQFEPERVGPVARRPYESVPANTSWEPPGSGQFNLVNTTIYFACTIAGKTVEIAVGT